MDDLNELPFLNDEMAPVSPGEGDFEELRRRYGVTMPGLLRRLLEVRNGGRVMRLWVTTRNRALKAGLHVSQFLFLKLDDFSPEGIVGCFRGWREAMGPQGLPFAVDEAGDLFFVDLSADPAPVKYACQDGEIQVFTVSPDLETFFAELHDGSASHELGDLYLYDGADKGAESRVTKPQRKKKGCCAMKLLAMGLLSLFLLDWWGRQPIWQEGNLRVYTMDGDYRLGVYDSPGAYLNLVDEQVVEIGSDERWLVVRQWRDEASHYYLFKKPLADTYPWDGEGGFSQKTFDELKVERGLPPFTWHNRSVDFPK